MDIKHPVQETRTQQDAALKKDDIPKSAQMEEPESKNNESFCDDAADDKESCVGLVVIDDYDEVMHSAGEELRGMLAAIINRKLAALAQSHNGIIKSFEKDKFLFVLSKQELKRLMASRFPVLKEVRDIDFGNKLPVTLTMGFGTGGGSLAKNMELARSALDLGQGRGGDQALVKDSGKYSFFGGVAKEKASGARVRARIKAFAISELIKECSEVIVLGHKRSDCDCFGAGIGVFKMAQMYDRECFIVMDGIPQSIEMIYRRISAEPEYRSAFISPQKASAMLNHRSLIVVTDVHRPSMIEAQCVLEAGVAKNIVVIDHHRRAAEYVENTVLTYHEPYASSTCELITEMLQCLKNDDFLKQVEADALLAGITVDTKNFIAKTGTKTFEAAAWLKRNGADSQRIRLLMQTGMENYRLRANAVSSAEIINENIAVSFCEGDNVITAQAADNLLDIKGVIASAVFCEEPDGSLSMSARSFGDINVQLIAERLGGGGHQTVAGAQFAGLSYEQAKQKLISVINKYMEESGNEGNFD